MTHKTKWLLFAPLGLVTIGAGASMVHWAGSLKDRHEPTKKWVAAGTAALAVFNAGLSLFGRAVVEKVLYEVREKQQATGFQSSENQLTAESMLIIEETRVDYTDMD